MVTERLTMELIEEALSEYENDYFSDCVRIRALLAAKPADEIARVLPIGPANYFRLRWAESWLVSEEGDGAEWVQRMTMDFEAGVFDGAFEYDDEGPDGCGSISNVANEAFSWLRRGAVPHRCRKHGRELREWSLQMGKLEALIFVQLLGPVPFRDAVRLATLG